MFNVNYASSIIGARSYICCARSSGNCGPVVLRRNTGCYSASNYWSQYSIHSATYTLQNTSWTNCCFIRVSFFFSHVNIQVLYCILFFFNFFIYAVEKKIIIFAVKRIWKEINEFLVNLNNQMTVKDYFLKKTYSWIGLKIFLIVRF